MRRISVALSIPLLVLALVPGWAGEERLALLDPERPEIRAESVALDSSDSRRRKLGALTYLGGVRLTSRDKAFGGFSAMHVARHGMGDRFTMLSDGGNIAQFSMGADWRPRDIRFTNLPDGPGAGWLKLDRDTESLAYDPASRRWWVGYEVVNQIWRYNADFTRAEAHKAPRAMKGWDGASGPESMARLADGRVVVIAERPSKRGMGRARPGIVFYGDPTVNARKGFVFGYVPPKGFSPTDMAELPDGRILVLNRRARLRDLFTACIVVIERDAIRRHAIVSGTEIARFEPPVLHDNFEALAVTREGRDTILWVASDDNLSWFQQSLLLKFRLDLPAN